MIKRIAAIQTYAAGFRGLQTRAPAWLGKHLSAILVAISVYSCVATPGILITNLPPYGSTSNLAGIILGSDPHDCRVAVLTYSSAAGWNTKPYCSAPLTVIEPEGSWVTDITTGGSDSNATRIAALLVSPNFSCPCVQGASFLSTNLISQALASAIVTRPSPGQRWLQFSGYDWWVKSKQTPAGPGPNYWSSSTNNVWVDDLGRLHLRITYRSNQWQCAEVFSARPFGYGSYRFRMEAEADALDPTVVLGLFTYSDDPTYNYREIDLEWARWGNSNDVSNAQFVVQPNSASHKVRFTVPAAVTDSTHLFTWETNRVSFQCQRGAYSPNPHPTNLLANWIYTLTVPRAGDENARINLWLFRGHPPMDTNEVEVIIRSFEYVPLGAAPPVSLRAERPPVDGSFRFRMNSQPDFRYQVQSSINLDDWQNFGTVLATGLVTDITDTNPNGFARRFFRTATLP